ncbi:chemotaxis protein CheW [Catenovulum sediminis]|uniref:Chemotaxis protein CheW n=1 Tax=Catenovulum sediminis TaxID=1740262 RepID=A0ABV1RHF2_9ALTE|nr:chemotaxis protein CheW [Catenovulum sediminis]
MTDKWVSFFIENERYCCNIEEIKEVLPYTESNPFPGSSAEADGILNIRNEIITILNGPKLFRCENNSVQNNILIVETKTADRMGITIDKVDQIIEFSPDQIESNALEHSEWIKGTVNLNNQLTMVVDFAELAERTAPEPDDITDALTNS